MRGKDKHTTSAYTTPYLSVCLSVCGALQATTPDIMNAIASPIPAQKPQINISYECDVER